MRKKRPSVLMVEDEEKIRRMLANALKEYRVEQAASGGEALFKSEATSFQVALVDLMLPDVNGLEVLDKIKKLQPQCQVIIMTGHGSIATAVRSIRMGAFDFVEKPFSITEIRKILQKAVLASGIFQSGILPDEVAATASRVGIVGYNSEEMQTLLTTAYKVASKDISVLIYGETGSGKELLARFIHAASPRANMVFLPVNCGALTESILESELFGHERGAFTGADQRRRGCFELADKGTIFLDEVSSASLGLQAKLLRALETGEFQRVGGEKFIKVDVRVVAATNIDLEEAVSKNTFRVDLYYRLGAVRLNIPPLRQRQKDSLPLAEHFLRRFSSCESGDTKAFSPETSEILMNYPWPGNVRELANVIHQAAVMAEGPTVLPKHLPVYFTQKKWQNVSFENLFLFEVNYLPSLKELEKIAIITALRHYRVNIKAAASALDISRATMHRKIKEYNIDLKKHVFSNETQGSN